MCGISILFINKVQSFLNSHYSINFSKFIQDFSKFNVVVESNSDLGGERGVGREEEEEGGERLCMGYREVSKKLSLLVIVLGVLSNCMVSFIEVMK